MQRIAEYTDSRGISLGVEDGLIRGVKVLGLTSKNGRTYQRQAIESAREKYEGTRVNIDHPANPGDARRYSDRFGKLSSVRVTDEGIFANLHYNPSHPMAKQFAWDAENAPENVGLSHVVSASAIKRNGRTEIESIDQVLSVDIVADPATTKSLFESEEREIMEKSITVEDIKAAGLWDVIKDDILQGKEDKDEVDQLKKANAELQGQLDGMKAKEELSARTDAVQESIKEAGLPKELVTDLFVEQCVLAADDEKLGSLIEDRKSLIGKTKIKAKEQRATEPSALAEAITDSKAFSAFVTD